MATQEELKLTDYKYIMHKVLYGKLNAKTYDKLYNEYKTEGGWLAKTSFTRKVRELCEHAQRDGIRLCRDSDCGLYIAETDEEWEAYKSSEQSRTSNIMLNIAMCEKKTVGQLAGEWFFRRDKKSEVSKENNQIQIEFVGEKL